MFGLGWIFGTVGLSYATGGAITPLPGIDKLLGKAGALSGKTTQLSGQVNAILSLIDKLIAKHKDDTSKLADLRRLQSQGRAFSERVGDAKTRLARYSDPQRYPELGPITQIPATGRPMTGTSPASPAASTVYRAIWTDWPMRSRAGHRRSSASTVFPPTIWQIWTASPPFCRSTGRIASTISTCAAETAKFQRSRAARRRWNRGDARRLHA